MDLATSTYPICLNSMSLNFSQRLTLQLMYPITHIDAAERQLKHAER